MSNLKSRKNQHLLFRAGFGPMAEMLNSLPNLEPKELWRLLKDSSSKAPDKIKVTDGFFGDKMAKAEGDIEDEMQRDAAMLRKLRRLQSREDLKQLNLKWMQSMTNSEAQLREKLALFWHGHFATRVVNGFFQQELLQIFRNQGLGNFKDLLYAVSKSAAMMQFLNAQQNKKSKPNENFAREVMELFTLGRGNYTENDIKEAARAFTGWGYNLAGEFVFRKAVHDDGTKVILGKTGNFVGDDVLNILLAQPATANFIAKKMYRFFVNDIVDEAKVAALGSVFFKSNYDIMALLEAIFTAPWFYEEKNMGVKIKSPIELLVGLRRFLPMQLPNEASQLLVQRTLGQVLFFPPNVAGWPGGKNWIDATTLMIRMRLPQVLTANQALMIKPKDDDDVMMGEAGDAPKKVNATKIDWALIVANYTKVGREQLYETIASQVLQTKQKPTEILLKKYLDASNREAFIKSTIIKLMSTPEYQMC